MRVVVVGAGIVGASTAFHLAEAGVDVVVVDRSHPGKATLAGAGIICPWATSATDPDFVDLYVAGAQATAEIVRRLAERGETGTGYEQVGALVLADPNRDPDDDLAATERRVLERSGPSGAAGELRRITAADAVALFPPLRPDLPALWIGGAARLDGRAITSSLLRAARIEPRAGTVELAIEQGRVRGVVLAGERIEGDVVVVAGGAWTDRLLAAHGVSVDVEPQKGQIVHLRVRNGPARPTDRWPTILPSGPHYLVPLAGGRVMVGATRETGSGFDTDVTVAGQHEVLTAALTWAPGLADAEVIETRVGLRPFARGRPTLGPVDGLDGVLVGTGLGAGGLTIGPLAGHLLSEQVLGSDR